MTTEERIVALERKLTRTRTLFAAVLVAGVGLACVGQVNPVREVIRAKRIEVVGENGKVRVGLETKDNLGIITTYNDDEQRLVRITGNPKEKRGAVVAYNGKGQDLVFLGANTEGNGMVATKSGKGQALAVLGGNNGGNGAPNAPNPNPQADKPIGAAGNAQPSLEKLQAFPQRYLGKTQVYKGIKFHRYLMRHPADRGYFQVEVESEKGNVINFRGEFHLVVEPDIAEQLTEHQKDNAHWPNSTIECVVIKGKQEFGTEAYYAVIKAIDIYDNKGEIQHSFRAK